MEEHVLDTNAGKQLPEAATDVKLTERKSETYYIVKNNFLESTKEIWFEWLLRPFLYYNREKFFQTYEISKEFDFNYRLCSFAMLLN